MKALEATITSILAQAEKQPVHLYRLTLTNVTLRFAAAKVDVVFPIGGDTWSAKAVKHEAPMESINHSQVRRARIHFGDGSQELFGYHRSDSLIGKRLEILRVYRNALDSADYKVDVVVGRIARVSWDYEWFVCEVTVGDTLRQKLPRRPYTVRCSWYPGGPECNNAGLFDISQAPFRQSGTAHGSADTFTDPNRTEADNYWKHGRITITDSNDVYRRKVIAFSGGTFTLDLPTRIAVAKDVSYTVQRGCDGSWDACRGLKAWGPSADNHQQYGGFLHIRETEQG